MEVTWFGEACIRLRGREGTIAADAYRSTVGPTGRGLTADIATYSHPDGAAVAGDGVTGAAPVPRPSSLEAAFQLQSPGEFEVHDILITGVATYRDETKGAERGRNVAFVYELEGLHAVHLGDIGHLLDEEMLGEMGSVDLACVPIGSALSAARAAELVAQLDAKIVVPMPLEADPERARAELDRFVHEMGTQAPEPVARLSVSISTVPEETTLVLLEARARV